jgi:non-heme chloroperoxidase
MPTVDTPDGVRIFYRDWGAGKPVLFCSGWGLSSVQWQYQMTSLCRAGARTVSYDRRGHGRSDDPGSGFDYDTLSDDLAVLIDRLDLADATLVAHSMGGGEIVRYLTRYGCERVSRVCLIGTTLPFSEQADDNPSGIPTEMLDAVRTQWSDDFGRWIEENEAAYFGEGLSGCEVGSVLRQWTRADLLRTSLRALIEFNRLGAATDFRDELEALRLPVRLIHGDHDASTPLEMSARLAAPLLPNGTLTVYKDAPHGLYLTHRARLSADLESFHSEAQLSAAGSS